jgi:glycosyltransferase involved in cell wall biosynthesis
VHREQVNVIYTTSPPESSHFIGLYTKLHKRIPWIAEFRDTWVYDPLNPIIERSKFRRVTDSFFERIIVKSADGIVVNSKIAQEYFQSKYLRYDPGRVATIYRGYDPIELPYPRRRRTHKEFLIVHTGNVSRSHYGRSIVPFLQGLLHAIKVNPKLEAHTSVRLIGDLTNAELKEISKRNLGHIVKVFSEVPFAEALDFQRNADMLLLINHPSARPTANIPGKLFEYIGMNKPVLAITTEGAVKDLVSRYGGLTANPLDPSEIGEKSVAAYDLHLKGKLKISGKHEIRQELRTDKMVAQLTNFIDKVLGTKHP